jgi:hypothetical protein
MAIYSAYAQARYSKEANENSNGRELGLIRFAFM